MTGALHVTAAAVALVVGVVVLVRAKGGRGHVALGRLFLAAMLLVNWPAAVVVLLTTAVGPVVVPRWVAVQLARRPARDRVTPRVCVRR